MNEIFELLRQKERRILAVLCLFLALALLFYVFIARGMKDSYTRDQNRLAVQARSFQTTDADRQEKKTAWRRWRLALKDMEELRSEYFYEGETISQDMRRDIVAIFQETGIPVPDIRYVYSEGTDRQLGGATATFQISGPYALIKRFVYEVEHFPRFLIVEKVDFVDIQRQSGALKLKITLAGYFENDNEE
jgi:hypothetical protein